MDIHIDSAGVRDNRDLSADSLALSGAGDGLPMANQADQARVRAERAAQDAAPAIPRNMRLVGLKSVTYVRPADALGEEEWDQEIEGRLRGVIGSSPPPISEQHTAGSSGSGGMDPTDAMEVDGEEVILPATQPIGPSTLAGRYSKTVLQDPSQRPMTDDHISPLVGGTGGSAAASIDQHQPTGPALAGPSATPTSTPLRETSSTGANIPAGSPLSRTDSSGIDEARTSQKRRSRGRFIIPPVPATDSSHQFASATTSGLDVHLETVSFDSPSRSGPLHSDHIVSGFTSASSAATAGAAVSPYKPSQRFMSPFRSGGGLRAEGGLPRYDFGTSAW